MADSITTAPNPPSEELDWLIPVHPVSLPSQDRRNPQKEKLIEQSISTGTASPDGGPEDPSSRPPLLLSGAAISSDTAKSGKVVLISKTLEPPNIRNRGSRGRGDRRNAQQTRDRALFFEMTRKSLKPEDRDAKIVEVKVKPPKKQAVQMHTVTAPTAKQEPGIAVQDRKLETAATAISANSTKVQAEAKRVPIVKLPPPKPEQKLVVHHKTVEERSSSSPEATPAEPSHVLDSIVPANAGKRNAEVRGKATKGRLRSVISLEHENGRKVNDVTEAGAHEHAKARTQAKPVPTQHGRTLQSLAESQPKPQFTNVPNKKSGQKKRKVSPAADMPAEWEDGAGGGRRSVVPSRHVPSSVRGGHQPRRPRFVNSPTTSLISDLSVQQNLLPYSSSTASPPRQSQRSPLKMADRSLFPEWSTWDFVDMFVSGIPSTIDTTQPLWDAFSRQGTISSLELLRDRRGEHTGNAKLRFKPPPTRDFWSPFNRCVIQDNFGAFHKVYVRMDREQQKFYTHMSPIDKTKTFFETTELIADSIDFGVRSEDSSMLVMRTCSSNPTLKVRLVLNIRRKEIELHFPAFLDGDLRLYRLSVPWDQAIELFEIRDSRGKLGFVLDVNSPPYFYRKLKDAEIRETHDAQLWKEDDAWLRQTDILSSRETQDALKKIPVNLKQVSSWINIGRWTTYRVMFDENRLDSDKLEAVKEILRNYNVGLKPGHEWKFITEKPEPWNLIDPQEQPPQNAERGVSSIHELAYLGVESVVKLPFAVRYQLEVCISNGWISEYSITQTFITKLAAMEEKKARLLLEHVALLDKRHYDPMTIFDLRPRPRGRHEIKPPSHCSWTRSVTVTASTLVYNSPAVEMTNRVIRRYREHIDYFLRVRFEDDPHRGWTRINAFEGIKLDELLSRIFRTVNHGIRLGDREYEFLAFGNSQFREHGAYFFAKTPDGVTASHIRAWMGRFSHERIVAKHTARIGQCFSTTRAVENAPIARVKEENLLDDVKRNGYTFSDGIGKISLPLAQLVAGGLRLKPTPSIFQFRLAGCKGVLAVAPELRGLDLRIRKSQYKFGADHNGLEVIRCSEYWAANLNRQLILVLSALGLSDEVFIDKQQKTLDHLQEAMEKDSAALDGLHQSIDPNQMTMSIASLVLDGFRSANEPFVTSLLRLWRAWTIKYLKEKAKIPVGKGACVLGCIDETSTLRGHFYDLQPSKPGSNIPPMEDLPQIFIQVSRSGQPGTFDVIEGKCILARNPSLHPGDIRVVHAIDVPALHHLKDCVVLPQTGDRDLSSMCSGGDLDGDDYIVIWDEDLVPKYWQPPMDYTPPAPIVLERDVEVSDMTKFFVNYIKNDRLPRIAQAHLALADYLDNGIYEDNCLELAELHRFWTHQLFAL